MVGSETSPNGIAATQIFNSASLETIYASDDFNLSRIYFDPLQYEANEIGGPFVSQGVEIAKIFSGANIK